MRRMLLMAWLAALPFAAAAETVYVVDKMYVLIRSAPNEAAPTVKTVESGAAFEVLERAERYTRVRDAQGAEGWVDARHLSAEAPARLQLNKLQEDLKQARVQLAEAQAKLKTAEAALAKEGVKSAGLAQALADKDAQIGALSGQAQAETAKQVAAPADKPEPPKAEGQSGFGLLGLIISFAMLGMGFVGGIVWVRESIRRRSGGMYLRV